MRTKLTPESSSIASISYDELNKMLRIEFKNGKTYEYPNLPDDLVDEMFEAESVGSYFATKIRKHYEGSPL